MAKVAIVKAHDLDDALDHGLQLLGGLEQYISNNDKVLIKPNLCAAKPWSTGTTTDPLLTEKVIRRIKEITDDITLCESDHSTVDAEYVFRYLGFEEIARRYDLRLINLSDRRNVVMLKNPDGYILKELPLHKEMLNADLIINLPVMKTNEISGITLSLKNMFGTIATREKATFHDDIHGVIADINRFVGRTLVILDARCAMQGDGPINGDVLHLDTLVFGDDMVAVDYIGAQIMGFDPDEIEHIALSERCGVGSTGDIQLLGVPVQEVAYPFARAAGISQRNRVKYAILKNKYCVGAVRFLVKNIRG